MKKKVLFVDDEEMVLEGLRRMLRPQHEEWEMEFVESGVKALELMGHRPFDVIVSDMRMPGMSGVQLLTHIKTERPDSIRILLTGHRDMDTAIDAVNRAEIFRFLTKPVVPENLLPALESAFEQRRLLSAERESLELQLQHAQKMSLIGQCAASAVHEFRNTLYVIQACTDMALDGTCSETGTVSALQNVRHAVGHCTDLTRRMLTFSRRTDEIRLAELEINEWLNQLKSLIGPLVGKRYSLRCVCAPEVNSIHADAGMLSQVVFNLAMNARDAMPEGGTLTLQVDLHELNAEQVPPRLVARAGRFVCLSVADTGCGMDRTTLEKIFQPFFTTKATGTGTGLGLAVVAQIVERHEGWIDVTSELGNGTTFRIFLPAHAVNAAGNNAIRTNLV
ncbi:MAG: response regulator [Verrucomicrobia bacterium]|nr:response regulator [Verrucomicrobiota bacterium]